MRAVQVQYFLKMSGFRGLSVLALILRGACPALASNEPLSVESAENPVLVMPADYKPVWNYKSAQLQPPILLKKVEASKKAVAAKEKSKANSPFRPRWSKQNIVGVRNSSYFASYSHAVPHFNDQFFDRATQKSMRTEYENRVAADQARDNAGLTEYHEEKSRFAEMRNFAKRAVRSIYQRRLKNDTAHLRESAKDAPEVIRTPVAVAFVAASVYNGKNMNFRVAEGLDLTSHTALRRKEASLSMNLYDSGLSSTLYYNRDDNLGAMLTQELSSDVSAVLNSGQRGSAQLIYSLSF